MGIFTRDESEVLNYDVEAFWYFAGTILTAIVLPWTWFLFRRLSTPRPAAEEDYDGRGPGVAPTAKVRRCGTATMEAKRRRIADQALSWEYRLSGGVKFQLYAVCILWVMLCAVCWKLKDAPADLRSFDPHAILGISPDAEVKEIKKAYRTKSLQHHPDKDQDNPLAGVMFQQVAKAYAALTDETARHNYAKYGNPDGPVQMKVGVALHPVVLVSKENQQMTLCIFFSILFIVPFSVICCRLRGSRLSYGGVSADTLRMLHACIDEEVKAEDGPGLLGASAEAVKSMRSDLSKLARAILEIRPTPLEPGVFIEAWTSRVP
jgi:translocation protein SEC63